MTRNTQQMKKKEDEMEEIKKTIREEKENLSSEVARLAAAQAELEANKAQCDSLQAALNDAKEELDALRRKLSETEKKLAELEAADDIAIQKKGSAKGVGSFGTKMTDEDPEEKPGSCQAQPRMSGIPKPKIFLPDPEEIFTNGLDPKLTLLQESLLAAIEEQAEWHDYDPSTNKWTQKQIIMQRTFTPVSAFHHLKLLFPDKETIPTHLCVRGADSSG
jgi:hypothetical protein